MKCSPFSTQDLEVMAYLRALMPSTTYWCDDMMKMLLFLADKKAEENLGRSLTTLEWIYSPVFKYLEASDLDGLVHWEQFVPDMNWLESIKVRLCSPLGREQKQVLKDVARMKKKSKYRFGSIALRRKVFSFPRTGFTFPNIGRPANGTERKAPVITLAKKEVSQTEGNGRAKKPAINGSANHKRLAE